MMFIIHVLIYLIIGIATSIHGMRTKWLPTDKGDVTLCILGWLPFGLFIAINYAMSKLIEFGKGKDV
jgi:hypothetical protein